MAFKTETRGEKEICIARHDVGWRGARVAGDQGVSNDTYHTRNRITSADTYVRYRAAFYGREVPPFQDPPIRPREGNEAPFLLHPTLYFRRRYIVRICIYIYISFDLELFVKYLPSLTITRALLRSFY